MKIIDKNIEDMKILLLLGRKEFTLWQCNYYNLKEIVRYQYTGTKPLHDAVAIFKIKYKNNETQ